METSVRRYLLVAAAAALAFVGSLTERSDAGPVGPSYDGPVDMKFETIEYTVDGRGWMRDPMDQEKILLHSARRAKVPGGWFITLGDGSFFYPDPDHSWDGKSID